MHPKTKPTVVVVILCMVILGVLLLPLPFTAYKVLKFFLSLGLLYTAGFFLRPCKRLSFQPSAGQIESGTRDPYDGSFAGTLRDSNTDARDVPLTEENSEIVRFLENKDFLIERNPLPPISLKLSLGLVITAVMTNPLTQVHLPRSTWMLLDVLVLALLGWALHLLREENDGKTPHFSLTRVVGQPPAFPFMTLADVFRHARRLWPAILGGTFAIALLGTKVGGGEFEDISLGDLLGQTLSALLAALFLAWALYSLVRAISNQGVAYKTQREQVPGEIFITVFLLILISLAFGGFFAPKPTYDPDDAPDGYVPYDRSNDY